jgi:hypothetical protein
MLARHLKYSRFQFSCLLSSLYVDSKCALRSKSGACAAGLARFYHKIFTVHKCQIRAQEGQPGGVSLFGYAVFKSLRIFVQCAQNKKALCEETMIFHASLFAPFDGQILWRTNRGKRYHFSRICRIVAAD